MTRTDYFNAILVINWEKLQRENEEKIKELKALLDKVDISCPQCQGVLQKTKEVSKSKKYFAYGYCEKCNLPIRLISRIANNAGMYSIISKNSIFKAEEVSKKNNIL